MKSHVRRAIAYIAGRVISGNPSSSIYDYGTSQYTSMSGSVDESHVSVYDYDKSCHISGSLSSLYHYGESQHVSLKLDGTKFSGYDYGTSSHFSGTVNGKSVSLYDYSCSSYFNYSI